MLPDANATAARLLFISSPFAWLNNDRPELNLYNRLPSPKPLGLVPTKATKAHAKADAARQLSTVLESGSGSSGYGSNACLLSCDGDCDDGGIGSEYDFCNPEEDCSDCGQCEDTCSHEGYDSCTWACDGECDEPYLCRYGTDCTDCNNCMTTSPPPSSGPTCGWNAGNGQCSAVSYWGETLQSQYVAPDLACCETNQTELSIEMLAQATSAGYWVSMSEVEDVVQCHCVHKLPLTADGDFVDHNAHLVSHASGYGDDDDAAVLTEINAGCADSHCKEVRQNMADVVVWQPFCESLSFLRGRCEVSSMQLAAADIECACAFSADMGASYDGPYYASYAEFLDALCAYEACEELVDHIVSSMNTVHHEWAESLYLDGLRKCNHNNGEAAAVVGIVMGLFCLLGGVGTIVGLVCFCTRRSRPPPHTRPPAAIVTATATAVTAVPVATAVAAVAAQPVPEAGVAMTDMPVQGVAVATPVAPTPV